MAPKKSADEKKYRATLRAKSTPVEKGKAAVRAVKNTAKVIKARRSDSKRLGTKPDIKGAVKQVGNTYRGGLQRQLDARGVKVRLEVTPPKGYKPLPRELSIKGKTRKDSVGSRRDYAIRDAKAKSAKPIAQKKSK